MNDFRSDAAMLARLSDSTDRANGMGSYAYPRYTFMDISVRYSYTSRCSGSNTHRHLLPSINTLAAEQAAGTYKRSMTMALAAPPPLQMAATPFSPFLSAWTRVTTILHPDDPMGCIRQPLSTWHNAAFLPQSILQNTQTLTCPRATAPPLTLTFDLSKPRIFSAPHATTENASLNSQSAISSCETPAALSARGTARVGAVGKSIGAQAASA
jgi:hypothetical protein